ncbi:MAG: nuclear transport factor 2 family protein [Parvularculaceae bacterium]
MTKPFADIQDVLQRYYDGLYRGDVALLKTVFHEQARYHTASQSPALHYDMPEYFDVVAARQSPQSRGDAYGFDVETIRFAGDDTAFAAVSMTMMGKRYADFLTFIRDGDAWRIVAKVFHYDTVGES